jgi:hypothetical protein
MNGRMRRRGVVLVDEDQLVRLLALPAAWRVLGFQPFPVRMSIGVLVEGPDLPEYAAGCEPPFVEPPAGRPMRYGVDYTVPAPAPAAAAGPLEERLAALVRDAIAGAAAGCEHPDPGMPIYDHTRGCAECAAAAVLALFCEPELRVEYAGEGPPVAPLET